MKYYLAARVLSAVKYWSQFVTICCSVLPAKKLQQWKIVKFNKRAGYNKRAERKFFSKWIIVQTQIRPCRVDFFLKINKRACTTIRYTRVCWFLGKNLSNFVPLLWKLHNPYCHNSPNQFAPWCLIY